MKTTEIPEVPITEFEVADGGTLRMANYAEADTRGDFYEHIADFWSCSPQDLADAMDECQPLAWAVHAIYSEIRGELETDLQDAQGAGDRHTRRLAALKTRLEALPEEPEDGAVKWLLGLSSREFEERVVPEIETWFGEPPNWNFEDEYLPESGTAQGAALAFFRNMTADELETLGVEQIEGDRPGRTYYAAELHSDIDEANRAAEAAGIAVRFSPTKD